MTLKKPFVVSFFVVLVSVNAYAFKIDTHAWVAQQVVNDLAEDGKLTINIGNTEHKLDPPDDVRDAILAHPRHYLLGSVGPDAAPDVMIGQLLFHPGNELGSGWMTNDWMDHLFRNNRSSPESVAYTYGVLSHISADTFGHTHVNQYSGNVFELLDGDDDTLVERRHFMLETYISNFTPPLKDYTGVNLGTFLENVYPDDVFADYISDVYFYDPAAQNEYAKSEFSAHLAAYYNLWDNVNSIAEDGIWHEIDVLVTQLVASYYQVDLSYEEAEAIVDVGQSLADAIAVDANDDIQRYANEFRGFIIELEEVGYSNLVSVREEFDRSFDRYQNAREDLIDELQDIENSLEQSQCSLESELLTQLGQDLSDINNILDPVGILDPLGIREDLLDSLSNGDFFDPLGIFDDDEVQKIFVFEGSLNGIAGQLNESLNDQQAILELEIEQCYSNYLHNPCSESGELLYQIYKNSYELQLTAEYPENELIDVSYTFYNGGVESYDLTDSNLSFRSVCDDIAGSVSISKIFRQLTELEQIFYEERESLDQDIDALREQGVAQYEAFVQFENAVTDLLQRVGSDVNPIQSVIRGWRSDIEITVSEYIKAATQVILNTADPSVDALQPLQDWFGCYHLAIIGVPMEVGGCEGIADSFSKSIDALSSIEEILLVGPLPEPLEDEAREIANLKDEIQLEIREELIDTVTDELLGLLPQSVQDFIAIVDQPVSDEDLNEIFSTVDTFSPILPMLQITDMAARTKAEMHVVGNSFDSEKFAPVYNSVLLSKLSLLDSNGLYDLAQAVNADTNDVSAYDNIVVNAFSNIDGNHGWMPVSPSLPNGVGFPFANEGASYSSSEAFVLWKNLEYRGKLFREIFKGPLSPGVDYPRSIGLNEIAHPDYPYDPCAAHAFPNDQNDKSCTAILIIPIITSLLN